MANTEESPLAEILFNYIASQGTFLFNEKRDMFDFNMGRLMLTVTNGDMVDVEYEGQGMSVCGDLYLNDHKNLESFFNELKNVITYMSGDVPRDEEEDVLDALGDLKKFQEEICQLESV